MTPLEKMQQLERDNPYWFGMICPVCRTQLRNGLQMHGVRKSCWEHADEALEMYEAINNANRR